MPNMTRTQAVAALAAQQVAAEAVAARQLPPAAPRYMADLIARAADLLAARWPAHVVEFPYWADGKDHQYTARLEWNQQMQGPRIQVFDARSGAFVCQSLEAWITKIDPHVWSIDGADVGGGIDPPLFGGEGAGSMAAG